MGTPTHDPAVACSEISIAALVLAKHERTGLVRAMRGEGGLAFAGMARKASGGRLFSSVWCQAERSAASSGHLERSMWNLSSAVRMLCAQTSCWGTRSAGREAPTMRACDEVGD